MQFEVTILGCGAATPTLQHQPTAQAINWQGKWILVDCGEGLQTNLRRYKIPLQKIELICVSHLHGDHVLGLPGLLGSMNLFGRDKPLHIAGPASIEKYVNQALELTHTYIRFPINYTDCAHIHDGVLFEWGENLVRCFPVKHRIEGYGFSFNHRPISYKIRKNRIATHNLQRSEILCLKGGQEVQRSSGELLRVEDFCEPPKPSLKYVYSGDTRPCKSVANEALNANLLYHEATFAHELASTAKATGHSTAQQAASLGYEANAILLVLGHLSSRYRDENKVLKEAQAIHPKVSLADEGMRIRLIPGEMPTVDYLE